MHASASLPARAAAGAAAACSSRRPSLAPPPPPSLRRHIRRHRRSVPTLSTAPGAGGGGGGGDGEPADDPFGPADGGGVVIPPEFTTSFDGGAGPSGREFAAAEELAAAAAAAAAEYVAVGPGADGDDPFGEQVRVFPRIKERDPYRRLGIGPDASFEEVQDARNYLYDTYKRHEASREAVEAAFDAILNERIKARKATGFRPPRPRGRRAGGPSIGLSSASPASAAAAASTRWAWLSPVTDRVGGFVDPTATVITLINDGTIFAVFGLWAALQRDPTFPLLSTICYAAWKLFDKRKRARPDGPFVGGSPVFGAAAGTGVALLAGLGASVGVARLAAGLPGVRPAAVGLFALNMVVGLVSIYLK